jgi:hypothetical protein
MGRRHMGRHELAAMVLAIGLLAPGLAQARFTFQAGDNIYADGQWFTAAEYEEYKKTYPQSPPKPPPAYPPPNAYLYPPQPQYPAPAPYVPQVQAPPTTTMVNGQPVITVAPPAVSAPLIDAGTSLAAVPPPRAYPYAPAPTYATAPVLRVATCRTVRAYEEFPGDAEKFDCGSAGQLTRPEMLAQGWKIDFVERVQPAGYKVMLSR